MILSRVFPPTEHLRATMERRGGAWKVYRFKEMAMPSTPRLTVRLSALLVAATCSASAFAQTEPSTTAPSVMPLVISAPSTAPAPIAPIIALPPTTQSVVESATQGTFVGTIAADKVYVRSGPGGAYYEMGQLAKGDVVQVVGNRQGWYQILPPNGTFCMIAKELVEVDASTTHGTVKADYVNVRAGTALSKLREPSAVLTVVRKGASLTILGSTDKYYEVAPPAKAFVYVSAQFVHAAPGRTYSIPNLKYPAGITGPAANTVTTVELPPAQPTVDIGPAPTTAEATPGVTASTPATTPTPVAETPKTVVVPPTPAVSFSNDAYSKFNALNARYQAELQKPVGHRDLEPLIADYKALAAMPNTAPSVQQGTASRLAALEKLQAIQKLQQENTSASTSLQERQKALQQEYAAAQKAIEDYETTGPYLLQGKLQASSTVSGKYALVNPQTGRVVGYVDPNSAVDVGTLVGQYIGVRGSSHTEPGTNLTIITVKNATLIPDPTK